MKKLLIVLMLASLFIVGCSKAPVAMENEENAEENIAYGVELKGFKTKDVYGNEFDEELFKSSKITVLNLWGTFCGPCIEEMPDLEKISNDYKDKDVQVVGIVIDDPSPEEAIKMLEQLGVNYTNIYADDKLKELITDKFDYVPVTLFIDSDGKVLKTFIAGSADKDVFERIIKKLIESN